MKNSANLQAQAVSVQTFACTQRLPENDNDDQLNLKEKEKVRNYAPLPPNEVLHEPQNGCVSMRGKGYIIKAFVNPFKLDAATQSNNPP